MTHHRDTEKIIRRLRRFRFEVIDLRETKRPFPFPVLRYVVFLVADEVSFVQVWIHNHC